MVMWLINTNTLKLENFVDERQTKYAILSHRWTEGEVTFQEFSSDDPKAINAVRKSKGFSKIQQCCRQALGDGLQYAWVDTCCIDKSSSAELGEAINSMFKYYQMADVCYGYLSDATADDLGSFVNSQWFSEGWTLQELIAPQNMTFFDTHWRQLGRRADLAPRIEATCGVPCKVLEGGGWATAHRPCIATIMSWASGRSTTRIKDRAYSLLGLFDVNMPLLYGEGEKAFQRLQEETFKRTEDQTIFAWEGVSTQSPSILASSPDQFSKNFRFPLSNELERRKPHMVTNEGVFFEAKLIVIRPRTCLVLLSRRPYKEVCIVLKKIDCDDRYARIPGRILDSSLGDLIDPTIFWTVVDQWRIQQKMITVVRTLRHEEIQTYHIDEPLAFRLDNDLVSSTRACIALRPYIGCGWVSYYGDTSSDARRRQLEVSAEIEPIRREVHSSSKEIESGQFSLGPVAIMKTRLRAIRYSLLGFNDRFLPVCILSTRHIAGTISSRHRMGSLFRSTDQSEHPRDWLHQSLSDDDGIPQTEKLKVAAITGGIYKRLSQGVFVFTANERNPQGLFGLAACILVKPTLAALMNRPNVSTFEAMQHISLTIFRSDTRSPFEIGLAVTKTAYSSRELRCNRCS